MIGFGGYGRVYSGELPDGRKVAVKLASAGSLQGSKQFRNEVNLLSRLHHRNLVRLEGYCNDKKYQVSERFNFPVTELSKSEMRFMK